MENIKPSWLQLLQTLAPWVVIIFAVFWHYSGIEKDVSLQKQEIAAINQKVSDLKQQVLQDNNQQDNTLFRFQDSINNQLSKMGDKIDQLLTMMANKRTDEGKDRGNV